VNISGVRANVLALAVALAACLVGCRAPAEGPPSRIEPPAWEERVLTGGVVTHQGDRAVVSWFGGGQRRAMSLVDLNTFAERVVDTGRMKFVAGSWSPDDRHFAATSHAGDTRRPVLGLLTMPDGDWQEIPCPQLPNVIMTALPRWSADGSRLVFDALLRQEGERAGIYVVYSYQITGGECEAVGRGFVRRSPRPLWGDFVVVARNTEQRDRVGMIRRRFFALARDSETGEPVERELLPHQTVVRFGASPDGVHAVAFCLRSGPRTSDSEHPGYSPYLLVDPEAARARLLTEVPLNEMGWAWSLEGDRIVAALWEPTSRLGYPGSTQPPPLCVVEVPSGRVTPLVDRAGTEVRAAGVQWVDDDRRLICWQPGESRMGEVWCYVFDTKQNYRLLPPSETALNR
jgi:hypothetical protein